MTCPHHCWVPGVLVGWAVTCLHRCEAGGGGDDVSASLLGAEMSVGLAVTRSRRCEAGGGGGDADASLLGARVLVWSVDMYNK
jgi:hypothetical protein